MPCFLWSLDDTGGSAYECWVSTPQKTRARGARRGGAMRLKDKVIIVTGGATGIGRAYCQRAAEEGARVVVADIADPKPAVK